VEIGGSTHPAQLGHHTVLTVSERTWNDFYCDLGLPDEYLVDGRTGSATRTARGRISGFGSSRLPRRSRTGCTSTSISGALSEEGDGLDHYAVGMKDPEGNEFDIN
jgi:hypothetical protein